MIVGFVSSQTLVGVQVDGGTEGSKVPPSREMVMNIVNFGNKKQPMSSRELVDLISERVPAQKQIDILRNTYPNDVMRCNLFTI